MARAGVGGVGVEPRASVGGGCGIVRLEPHSTELTSGGGVKCGRGRKGERERWRLRVLCGEPTASLASWLRVRRVPGVSGDWRSQSGIGTRNSGVGSGLISMSGLGVAWLGVAWVQSTTEPASEPGRSSSKSESSPKSAGSIRAWVRRGVNSEPESESESTTSGVLGCDPAEVGPGSGPAARTGVMWAAAYAAACSRSHGEIRVCTNASFRPGTNASLRGW